MKPRRTRKGQVILPHRPQDQWIGICPHDGKRRFVTRGMARNAWKAMYPGSPMSVYKCGEYFHFGNNRYKRTNRD